MILIFRELEIVIVNVLHNFCGPGLARLLWLLLFMRWQMLAGSLLIWNLSGIRGVKYKVHFLGRQVDDHKLAGDLKPSLLGFSSRLLYFPSSWRLTSPQAGWEVKWKIKVTMFIITWASKSETVILSSILVTWRVLISIWGYIRKMWLEEGADDWYPLRG